MKNFNQLPEEQQVKETSVRYLRSRNVQKMMGIGASTLQSLRIKGIIPAYKVSGIWLYKEAEVINAIEHGKIKKEE